jgi:hypothetical protein
MSKENCTKYLQKQGLSYPRTCKECGLLGCKYENYDKVEPAINQKAVDKLDAFFRLQPIQSAPKDRYILLAGDSGYLTTPLRFSSGRWSNTKECWVDHSGEPFRDGGPAPIFWMEIPEVPKIKKTAAQWLTEKEFSDLILLDNWPANTEYSREEFEDKLLKSRVQISNQKLKQLIQKE